MDVLRPLVDFGRGLRLSKGDEGENNYEDMKWKRLRLGITGEWNCTMW